MTILKKNINFTYATKFKLKIILFPMQAKSKKKCEATIYFKKKQHLFGVVLNCSCQNIINEILL